ncbi:uncharacterized protein LOC127834005 [Dreissena polymorpha]|uniref:uncharacterized protein LOC127834005 n=1 Tax=Dreissena polymorpha TaxID=45954 RepID=UPI0022651760|nr:uncharacterized protein LOC127834005 [Dreissena polymorpha]
MTYEQFKNEFGFDAAEIVDEFTPCADPMLNNLAVGQPLINDQSFETNETPNSSLESPLVQNEFKDINVSDVQQFIKNEENKNTAKKTLNDTNKFKRFLASRGEYREMHHIEVDVLDDYISTFILSLQKSNSTEYEPTSIRGILGSLDRKLKRHRFPYSIMAGSGPQFSLTRQTYNAKKKSLKKQGKGNRPCEAAPLTDGELEVMWQKGVLGSHSPTALVNTLWLNNCLHFGLRGTKEQYNLRWGDITLKAAVGGTEYLDYNERQTKTRTGENVADVRRVTPKMFSTGKNDLRNPVEIYKLYSQKRPTGFSGPEDPFFLAPNTVFGKDASGTSGEGEVTWFIRQRVGMNKMGKMLKTMANDAGLQGNKRLTNHSTRKHLVQKLREHNVPPTDIMAITGHKNVQSIINYSCVSEEQQKKCSNILACHTPRANNISSSTASTSRIAHTATSTTDSCDSFPQTSNCPEMQNVNTHHNPISFQQQFASSLQSQFSGATFHIANFHVHNYFTRNEHDNTHK